MNDHFEFQFFKPDTSVWGCSSNGQSSSSLTAYSDSLKTWQDRWSWFLSCEYYYYLTVAWWQSRSQLNWLIAEKDVISIKNDKSCCPRICPTWAKKSKNRTGPKTEPWGSPLESSGISDIFSLTSLKINK